MSRAGNINKVIVVCTIDVVDDLGCHVCKEQVCQGSVQCERESGVGEDLGGSQ